MSDQTTITLTINSTIFRALRSHLSPFISEASLTKGSINIMGMMQATYDYDQAIDRLIVRVTKGDPSEIKTALEQAVKDVSPK